MADGADDRGGPGIGGTARMTHLINLMPHDLVVISGAQRFVLPRFRSGRASGSARGRRHAAQRAREAFLPLATVQHGTVADLPEPRPDVPLVVSEPSLPRSHARI